MCAGMPVCSRLMPPDVDPSSSVSAVCRHPTSCSTLPSLPFTLPLNHTCRAGGRFMLPQRADTWLVMDGSIVSPNLSLPTSGAPASTSRSTRYCCCCCHRRCHLLLLLLVVLLLRKRRGKLGLLLLLLPPIFNELPLLLLPPRKSR